MSGAESMHPSLERLAEFSLGKLDVSDAAEIADHVANCTTCQDLVDNQPDDAFVALVRKAIRAYKTRRNGEAHRTGNDCGKALPLRTLECFQPRGPRNGNCKTQMHRRADQTQLRQDSRGGVQQTPLMFQGTCPLFVQSVAITERCWCAFRSQHQRSERQQQHRDGASL